MHKIPVSVLVPVKNEIANIRDCLRSVEFADEVVVVDSASIDGTIAAAEQAGARVVQFAWDGKFPRKKNWALEHIPWRHEWVLIVDADERIPPELAREIAEAIARPGFDGFFLNRRFWFLGGWIRHCGYFPSWNLRLFRHRLGRYEKVEMPAGDHSAGDNEVHEHVLLDGRSDYLRAPMDHYAFPTYAIWIEKHNRYSDWEATVARDLHEDRGVDTLAAGPMGSPLERKRWLKRVARGLPGRPALRFLYHYLIKQGFRDGWRGWVLCRSLAWYEWVGKVKARERGIGSKP
jgi:glycosyltransferase involved in cell wall biosynthesis